jgi:hypothetical protein
MNTELKKKATAGTVKIPANSDILDYVTCKTQTTANLRCGAMIPMKYFTGAAIKCPRCGRGTY